MQIRTIVPVSGVVTVATDIRIGLSGVAVERINWRIFSVIVTS